MYCEECQTQVVASSNEQKPTSKVKGVLSLVFGILSILNGSLAFAIAGIILGNKAVNTSGEKLGNVGKTLSVVGLIIIIIVTVFAGIILAIGFSSFIEAIKQNM